MYKFNSQIKILGDMPREYTVDEIKNEPMLFNCDAQATMQMGGELTNDFLNTLPDDWKNANDLVIDSRVHMLFQNFLPCIGGWHGDDVPREREDGQPNYKNPSYYSEHIMVLVGDCCPTQFAIGEIELPEVSLGEKYYKIWSPIIEEKIKKKELQSILAPTNKLIYFDWQTLHTGTKAFKNGWRWFIRASKNTKRVPTNELRKQVQVYLDINESW